VSLFVAVDTIEVAALSERDSHVRDFSGEIIAQDSFALRIENRINALLNFL
jgi:hypothetical protein